MRLRVIAVLFLILSFGVCPVMRAGQLRSPSLSEIVLIGLRPVKELNPADFPPVQQVCAQKYLDAIAPDSGLWVFEAPSSPDEGVLERRRNLIDQIVAILGQNVRSEAEAFAYAVPLRSEWEGMSEGPVDEGNFADNWLSKRPGTSIAPYLHLFKAHRFRAGYEAARASYEKGLWPILARRYREELDEARSSSNPLISCIANDMEGLPFVYLEGYGWP